MNHDGAAEGKAAVGADREFAALPGSPPGDKQSFLRCLAEIVRLLEIDVTPGPDSHPSGEWDLKGPVWAAVRKGLPGRTGLPEDLFDLLIEAAVYEPDPSHNRWFVEAALNAFGRRRVQSALLGCLRSGTDRERAGAARAWYWTALPVRYPHLRAEIPAERRAGLDEATDVVAAWNEATLREFVGNEDLDVRRCLLPGLPLTATAYAPELRPLVDTAVAIARAHPDEYIRHRAEIQVQIQVHH